MISGARVLVSAISQEANWNKFNFCSVTYQFKQPSATLDASNVFGTL
jgi:hypothetical protein